MNFFGIINNLFKITEIKHQANIFNYLKKINRISLLKIDTEGYEIKVIKSLGSDIKKIKYILLELKFIHFYKNYSQKKLGNIY